MSIYMGEWSGPADLASDFDIDESEIAIAGEILLASYDREEYTGRAFVLLRQNGLLYEVNGSHCSCMGLEGTWEPEETTKAAIIHRMDSGYLGSEPFAEELRNILAGMPDA